MAPEAELIVVKYLYPQEEPKRKVEPKKKGDPTEVRIHYEVVFRDAVTLAVVSGLIFLIVLLCTLHSSSADTTESPCPTSMTCSQSAHPK